MRRPGHLSERFESDAEVQIATAAIDNRGCTDNLRPEVARDVDRFSGRLTGRDDILDHEDALAGVESKPPSQHQLTITALGKHRSHAKRSRDLVSDDQPPKRGRQHHLRCPTSDTVPRRHSERRRVLRVLKNECALKISGTVKTRRQLEVPFEQRPALRKHVEHLSGIHRSEGAARKASSLAQYSASPPRSAPGNR